MFLQNPWALVALAGLAVPVWVHLVQLRRARRLPFSQLMLVTQAADETNRRHRLIRRLLMATRLLALLLLVLGFAGPSCTPASGSGARQAVLVVIDDSPSMQVLQGDEGSLFDQAQSAAEVILQGVHPEDQSLVVGLSQAQAGQPFLTPADARKQIWQLAINPASTPHGSLLARLGGWVSAATHPRKTVYLLSDFQTSQWLPDSTPALRADSSLRLVAVPLGASATGPNAWITQAQVAEGWLEPGRPLTLRVAATAQGSVPATASVALMVAGQPRATAPVVWQPQGGDLTTGQATLVLPAPALRGEWLPMQLTLTGAQGPAWDDAHYLALQLPGLKSGAYVASGSPNTALSWVQQRLKAQVPFTDYTERQAPGITWQSHHLVVWDGPQVVPDALTSQLTDWVRGGGSLVLMPKEGQPLQPLNQLLASLQLPQATAWANSPQGQAVYLPRAEPWLKGIWQDEPPAGGTPATDFTVFQWLQLSQRPGPDQVRLRTPDGEPLLCEFTLGRGRVLLWLTYPDGQHTDWHLKASWAPVVYRLWVRLAQPLAGTWALALPGTEGVQLPAPSGRQPLRVQGPVRFGSEVASAEFIPTQRVTGSGVWLNPAEAVAGPGLYRMLQADSLLAYVGLNLSPTESDLRRPTPEALRGHLAGLGLANATVAGPSPAALTQAAGATQVAGTAHALLWAGALMALVAEACLLGLRRPVITHLRSQPA